MGAGAGVCIFVFVYYDPHNARHVHEIDEATAMPQAIRLTRWATGLSKGCSEAADRTRSVAQRRVFGFRCGVPCVAVRIRVSQYPFRRADPNSQYCLRCRPYRRKIGSANHRLRSPHRCVLLYGVTTQCGGALRCCSLLWFAVLFVPRGIALWGFIRRAALRCVEWWRLLMARVGAAAARGLVAPTGATC